MTLRTVVVSILVSFASTAPSLAQAAVKHQIDIPQQQLGSALAELAKQTRIQVVYSTNLVEGRNAYALSGTMTPEEALTQLLSTSGLRYEFLDAETVTLSRESGSNPMRVNASSPLGVTEHEASSVQNSQQDAKGTEKKSFWDRFRLAQVDQGKSSESFSVGPSSQGSDGNAERVSVEEVIVTAQKRVERLQDVPMSVSTINAETLVNNNQLRLEDYYQKLPGVSLTLAGNGSEPQIIIRGITTGTATNPTIGVVVDEVSYGRSRALGASTTTPDIDPGDLARVEVLRGPQGALYGASSIGGLLKFVTVDPSTDGFSGRLQVGSTYVRQGDDVGYGVRGAVNVPLSDTLAVRLSGFTLRDPGYIDNAETGERDINSRDSDGGRVSALWQPSENFSLKLSALIQDSLRHGMADSDPTLEPNLQRRELRGIGDYGRKSNAYSATMEGKVGSLELVSATGYSVDELNSSLDQTAAFATAANTHFPGTGRASIVTFRENQKFTQEVRASLPIGERLDWLLGLFYTDEKDQSQVDVHANTSTGAIAGLLQRNKTLPASSFEERAVFTNLTVELTDRWDVQFGGRISENKQAFARGNVAPVGAYPLNAPLNPATLQTSRSEDDAFTYLAASRFRVLPDLMAYIRLASGYRPGGPNFNCGILPPQLCEFDSDSSNNYEIGVKSTVLDGRLSFDTSVYYIDWKDLQVGPLTFAPGTTFVTNASRAKSQGVELSVESRPLTGLSLSTWVTYNDAVLTDPFPSGATTIAKGTRLPFSSKWTGGLSVEQAFPTPLWNGAKGFVGVHGSYIGERPGTLSNTNMLRAKPSYVQINLRTRVIYDTWSVNAFVNNLTDKRGMLRGGDDGLTGGLVNYIQPRTIGLSLSKDF